MNQFRAFALFGLLVASLAAVGATSAAEAHTYLENRNPDRYAVSPAMMHAIDIIVAEKMKMRHRRR